MEKIDTSSRTTALNPLTIFGHLRRVQTKNSSSWPIGLISPENEFNGPQFIRNTVKDELSINNPFLNVIDKLISESNTSNKTTEFLHRKFLFSNKSSSIENTLNNLRVEDLRENFTSELLQALRQEPVEPGVQGQADTIISKCLKTNKLATTTWLNELFIDNFNRPALAADILLLAGRLSYQDAKPAGVTIAISGLTHKNGAVQEAAIRAFENWATPECLQILENIQVQPKWLSDYLEDVKRDLKAIHSEAR